MILLEQAMRLTPNACKQNLSQEPGNGGPGRDGTRGYRSAVLVLNVSGADVHQNASRARPGRLTQAAFYGEDNRSSFRHLLRQLRLWNVGRAEDDEATCFTTLLILHN